MADEKFEKTRNNLKVTLDLDNQLTWQELFRFVDLARTSGVSPEDPVGRELDPMETNPTITGLYVFIDAEDVSASA